MNTKQFLRRESNRYSKLGKRRKNKQKWKRPTGRDNKMREKRKGYPATVNVGYKTPKKEIGKVKGKKVVKINNIEELKNVKKNEIAIIANVGKKKKIEISKEAKELKVEIYNINPKTYLKKNVLKGKKENKK